MSDCSECGHPFDPHAVLATQGNPMLGGIILCQDRDCTCLATWSVGEDQERRDAVLVPEGEELAEMRESVWSRSS